MYTLHKLPEGFIITSDEKPIKGDLCFDLEGNPGHKNQLYIVKCLRTSDDSYWVKHSKKLIAQQDQIDFSNLTEEEQKEIGWIEPKSWNIEIETECSVCGLTGVHKMSCKTPSLRTQQPRFTNGKIKITKIL
jgi:hypothetical protein